MRVRLFDIETNGLLDQLDKVHCLVIKDAATGQVFSCADQEGYLPVKAGLKLLEEADLVVGHNIIKFDLPALKKVYPRFEIPVEKVRDTLVSGYSPVLRHRIVTRWMELEEAQRRKNQIDLNDPYALRQVLLTYSEKVIELEHQRDGLQSIVGQHLHSLTDVARMLPGVNSMRVHGNWFGHRK